MSISLSLTPHLLPALRLSVVHSLFLYVPSLLTLLLSVRAVRRVRRKPREVNGDGRRGSPPSRENGTRMSVRRAPHRPSLTHLVPFPHVVSRRRREPPGGALTTGRTRDGECDKKLPSIPSLFTSLRPPFSTLTRPSLGLSDVRSDRRWTDE